MKAAKFMIGGCVASVLAVGMLTGCANKADIVRPDQAKAGSALGEKLECTEEMLSDSNGTERFVVEWGDGDRATLESEMARGIALVKFTCDGIKVLRNCAVPGEYAYQGISKKTKSLQVADAASASANFSSPALTGSVKTALEQGRALDLAYVMVGVQSTTVADVSRDQIKRDACKDATHFVFQTKVGAFAMASGEKGKATAAGELLGYGNASGEVSSSRNVAATDGDAKACDEAKSKDEIPTENCQAVMRVSILPLATGKLAAVDAGKDAKAPPKKVDTRNCPEGFVYQDDHCVEPKTVENFLCKEGDMAQCKEQCNKGNAASCGRFSDALAASLKINYWSVSADFGGADKLEKLRSYQGDMQAKLQAACTDEFEASACAGAFLVMGSTGENTRPTDAAEAKVMMELATVGCEWGNSMMCEFIVGAYGEEFLSEFGIGADAKKLEEIVGEGCDFGSAAACQSLGDFFYQGTMIALEGEGVSADYSKSAKYLAKACYGGISDSCFWSSLMYATSNPDECATLLTSNLTKEAKEDYLSLTWPAFDDEKQIAGFCKNTSKLSDKEKAYGLADKACYIDGGDLSVEACGVSIDLME